MAYADVTSCVAGKLQSTRNRLSARQAAETRILASRNTRSLTRPSVGRAGSYRDRARAFYLPAGGGVICGGHRVLEQELGPSPRREPVAEPAGEPWGRGRFPPYGFSGVARSR